MNKLPKLLVKKAGLWDAHLGKAILKVKLRQSVFGNGSIAFSMYSLCLEYFIACNLDRVQCLEQQGRVQPSAGELPRGRSRILVEICWLAKVSSSQRVQNQINDLRSGRMLLEVSGSNLPTHCSNPSTVSDRWLPSTVPPQQNSHTD